MCFIFYAYVEDYRMDGAVSGWVKPPKCNSKSKFNRVLRGKRGNTISKEWCVSNWFIVTKLCMQWLIDRYAKILRRC